MLRETDPVLSAARHCFPLGVMWQIDAMDGTDRMTQRDWKNVVSSSCCVSVLKNLVAAG